MASTRDSDLVAGRAPAGAARTRARASVARRARHPGALLSRPSRGADRWSALRRRFVAGDAAAALVAGALGAIAGGLGPRDGSTVATLLAAGWLTTLFVCGLYAVAGLRSWASGVPEIPRMLVSAWLVSWPLLLLARALESPRALTAGLVGAMAVLGMTVLLRAVARAHVHGSAALRQRTVIVGSGLVAGQLTQKLRTHKQFGLVPIGFVDDDVHEPGSLDLPRLGRLDDLSQILAERAADRVMIAFSLASHERLHSAIRACRDHGVAVDVVPRLFEFLDGTRTLDHVGGLPVLSIGPQRLSRSSQAAKRMLDAGVATLALTVLAPVIALLALAIKRDSRGPVFFRQQRAGRDGSVFELYKFRSMYSDAEERKRALQAANDLDDGVMFKIHEDPRVTRVGRFLRRSSLDELPQLFNVLRGEMSLVGPRPLILVESDALDEEWHERRLDLRPGITGPWQVYGRSDIPFEEMVRFDYQYVAGWSLARDVEILLATVPAVLAGRGAY